MKALSESMPSRFLYDIFALLLLQFLIVFAQGQGPGGSVCENSVGKQEFAVSENSPKGTLVGIVPTQASYTYSFKEPQTLFRLDSVTGEISTLVSIDREQISKNPIHILVIRYLSGSIQECPIEVFITVLDENDNSPIFNPSSVQIQFNENVQTGYQVPLGTATDLDQGANGTVTKYSIISYSDSADKKFTLVQEGNFPYIKTIDKLDREEKDSYSLNISCHDDGVNPRSGFLYVDIVITDYNDNSPQFNPSQYVANINESAPVGTLVIKVEASDRDIGQNGEITYMITDENDQFQINNKTGEITTKKTPLKCLRKCERSTDSTCQPTSCVLTIKVEDGGRPPLPGRAYVTVNVKDENNNAPNIKISYVPAGNKEFSTVDENAANFTRVATLSVTDEDKNSYGEISSVKIIGGNELGHFKLKKIFTFYLVVVNGKNVLDRERVSQYNLTVLAADGGLPPKTSQASILIYVKDVNDHHPMFEKKEYQVTLSELIPVGSFVVDLVATDLDTGANAKLHYDIVSGNDFGWFHISKDSGLITTKSVLHHDVSSQVVMNVSVHDGSLDPFYNYTIVIITIRDENNIVPTFTSSIYNVSIREELSMGSEVVTVSASDEDSGLNGTVVYALHPDVDRLFPGTFEINTNTGLVQTRRVLDRETKSSYVVMVIAKDRGTPPLSSTATLSIAVTDVNDNKPKFYPQTYYASILENKPRGTSVTRVTATDPDDDENGDVRYYFVSQTSAFSIDERNGIISTAEALNRESQNSYTLYVQAKDNNPTHTAEVQAMVKITVTDQIDNAPVFSNTPYEFNIKEDASNEPHSLGRTVGTVLATSADSNPQITYTIADGDPNRVFQIDQTTGVITTNARVDREVVSKYNLKIVAKNGNLFSDQIAKITVDDVNDNAPKFRDFEIKTYVIENWPIGHDIYLAKATDADADVNSVVSYTLQTTSDIFKINGNTGMIYLAKQIENSPERNFNMVVTATDSGTPQLSSTVDVHITIADVNDHTPVFEHPNYERILNESIAVNSVIFQLTATDQDLSRNGEIFYNITYGNSKQKFGIFPDGKIYVAQKLDRETEDHYKLTITAKDNAVEPRSSSANITVTIEDDNDNRPLFVNASYVFYIPENRGDGYVVGTVKATDLDIGRNAELAYYLDQNQDNFTINIQTGEIASSKGFDRETTAMYTFPVTVMDNGLRRLSDSVSVIVHVTDVNDNAPSFKESIYLANLMEDAPKYTPVIRIVATDLDENENSVLTYAIISGNDDQHFKIDSGNGQIALDKALDRETEDSYEIIVQASDSGNSVLTATTMVSISVLDVNDNAPLFAQTLYEMQVSETQQPGDLVGYVTATDTDLGNNAVIQYLLSGKDNDGTFSIDQNNGKLFLNKKLDFESKSVYMLNISAIDKGLQPLSQYARLIIRVADTNDNTPEFVNTPSIVQINEDLELFSNVVKLSAKDQDSGKNGEIIYTIKSQDPVGNHFNIKRDTGEIYLSKNLDREMVSSYKLTVVASDKAEVPSSRKSSETSITVEVIDVNDNDPKFISMDAIVINYPNSQGLISTVVAEDPDFGPNGTVVYELTSGSTSNFRLESNGKLYLQRNLPQSPVTYSIRVTARDSGIPTPRSTFMDITIILVGSSGGPVFVDTPYNGQIQENVKSGYSVLNVKTSTSANMEYYITRIVSAKSTNAKHFQIDKTSGIITTLDVLDRELHGDKFTLQVCAMERQDAGPKASVVEVVVTVTDVNDTPPKFSQSLYSVDVIENLSVGKQVAKVTVTDDDNTGSLSLNIIQGNDGRFAISQNGAVTVAQDLDRETKASYDLIVQAFDGENNSQCTVSVNIIDVNDEVPVFTKPMYTFDLEEDMAVGTTINRVEAIDTDLDLSGKVTYTLLSDWADNVFLLDSAQGIFTLNKPLDFEQVPLYILKVRASDGGSPSMSSTVTVYMNVKDINDNSPSFDPSSYSAKVSENITLHTSILTVSATDQDSGVNSLVEYSIIKGDQKQQFIIDPKTGVVSNTKTLDREDIPFYVLEVMATDQSEPPSTRHSASTQISLIVEDINDNAPVFISPSKVLIKENTPINNVGFQVKAEDKDSGSNEIISYSMSSNENVPFRMGRVTGEIFVQAALDRETTPQYTVSVTATDNGTPSKSTIQTLTINVQDVNDNSPVFERQDYQTTVPENVTVGKTLLTVKADDADEGLNGLVRYFIIGGEDNSDFSVDQSSGVLRVKKKLDYERKQYYDLTIQAEDSGADTRYSTTKVKVVVTDINDNAPVFLDSPYHEYVMENLNNLPVPVARISARDDDSYPYNKITYSFLDGNEDNIFQINENTGEITCHKVLDRETKDKYTLVVRGKDNGPLPAGTGIIVVQVADVNDNSPVFEHQGTYIGHILENQDPNRKILAVKATDKDDGPNAQIVYRLEDSINDKFTIHPNTGVIVAQQRLDREETDDAGNILDHYNLRVIASDRGSHPRETTAMVTIYVDDINDNVPMFEKSSYRQTINNPTPSGEFVIGVTALDRDTGSNGQVKYSLSGADAARFNIDMDRGIITTRQTISATPGSTFVCQVTATDQGDSPSSSVVSLTVTVSNSNTNNKPLFSNTPDTLSVDENVAVGTTIQRITATSPIGNSIDFFLVGGNIRQGFSITKNAGELIVANTIDYEMTTNFLLWIEARDNSNPPLSAFRKITVNVSDLNDNTPRFDLPLYVTSISENRPESTSVIKVVAMDTDSGDNKRITYSLHSGNPHDNFTINSQTGLISTRTQLDREKMDVFNLIIHAVDHGNKPLTGSTTVKVSVIDQNDNPPKFNRQFSAQINEDTDVGRFVIQVTTSDADIGTNANVTYSLKHDKFAIDMYSGNIYVKSPLDIESMNSNHYLLSVRAADGTYTNDGTVTIFLKDVNDEKPEFAKNALVFEFSERQSSGSVIGTVTALDRDVSSPNNKVYYSLKYPSSKVEINATNGRLTSKVEMVYDQNATDRYLSNLLEVVVKATDFGTPPLSSEAVVKISILDANDHAPVFEKTNYFSAVPLTVEHGDNILKVVAKDKFDVGVNAEVQYLQAGGNGSGYFTVSKDSGYVTVASQLLPELQNQVFILRVRAQDRGTPVMFAETDVKLQITGVNEHAPVFSTTVFEVTIPENTAIGKEIAKISATDADVDGPNGRVSYYIVGGNENDLFSINEINGGLSVKNGLDFEKVQSHHLNITVRDTGLLYKEISAIYTVNLVDVNDNPPVFKQTEYVAFIAENATSGEKVTQITAEDADTSKNAIIEYSLGSTTKFSIEPNTGIIRSQGVLDYEDIPSYTATVIARNPGTQLQSTTRVKIQLVGVNEYYPVFAQQAYSFSIKESAAQNDPVGSVLATDKDHGEDGYVYYYLMGASNNMGFKINDQTGLITVSGKPDYESSPVIKLNVLAKNWGSIKGNDTSQCVVTISVQDANDAPVFSKSLYKATIQEGSGGDVSVITVSATDNDHKQSDKIFSYTILGGNVNDAFKINSVSGLLETSGLGLLDRETQPVYNVTVGAVDTGSPPQTGSAVVEISLGDINDNKPYFQPKKPTGYVLENKDAGTKVMTLSDFTYDLDLSPNAEPYTYQIVPGSHNNVFFISESTGFVQTKQRLDREAITDYDVSVVVFDNGSTKMSSTLTFHVIVQDVNDVPPTLRNLDIQIVVLDNKYPTGFIGDVKPNDQDIIGDFTCAIQGENFGKFEIQSGCDLRITGAASSSPSYSLKVNGSDGIGSNFTNVEVTFLHISKNTLDNTVILKIQDISPSELVAMKYKSLKTSIEALFSANHVAVLYHIMADQSNVQLFLAVQTPSGGYVKPDILKAQLTSNKASIQSSVSIKLSNIGFSVCDSSACGNGNGGECVSKIVSKGVSLVTDSPEMVVVSPELHLDYTCNCYPEFSGTNCTIPVSPCGSNYCKNGGVCVSDSQGNKLCQCTSGWQGDFCDTDKRECDDPNFCKNGARCENTEGSFICHCREGFSGSKCEQGSDNCQPNPCKNKGVCRNEADDYRCECPFTFWGKDCQATSVGFGEGSYIELDSIAPFYNNINIIFTTIKSDALLLYNPAERSNDFISLEIVDGSIRFSYNLGTSQSTFITVPKKVTTGGWFQVIVNRDRNNATVKVSSCPSNGGPCDECRTTDNTCYRQGTQNSERLDVGNQLLNIGGVKNISTITTRPGQVVTHDFIGCIRSFVVNTVDLLQQQAIEQNNIDRSSCPRDQGQSKCTANTCSNGGQCIDEWSSTRCKCPEQYTGLDCSQVVKPIGFGGANSFVLFTQRDGYYRDQMVSSSSDRKRRSNPSQSSVFIRFRTTAPSGLLFYASQSSGSHAVLWVNQGQLQYSVKSSKGVESFELPDVQVSDGKWYNATVKIDGTKVTLIVDSNSRNQVLVSAFKFSDPSVTTMALGSFQSSDLGIKDFDGCISKMMLDGESLPLYMNGSTDRFVTTSGGGVESGCSALCANNPCGASSICAVSGEEVKCSKTGASEDDLPIGIGVIVVIAFFGVLILVIVVVFIICYVRRKNRGKRPKEHLKVNGNHHGSKHFGNNSGHSHPDSGYGDRTEDEFINNHITNELHSGNRINGHLSRPDIISSDQRHKPLPLEMDDGTVIIDNGDAIHLTTMNEDAPELYDIDATSSIAPSEIDVTAYYKGYRDGKVPHYHHHHHLQNNHHKSHHKPYKHTESPLTISGQLSHRNSPALRVSSSPAQMLDPMYHGSARASPAVHGTRQSPMNPMIARHSPHIRASPLAHNGSARGTPLSDSVHHSRTSSDHSLASHHSCSSNSSVPRTAIMTNGHIKHGHHDHHIRTNNHSNKVRIPQPRNVKGLTLDEVNKLNTRPNMPSPESMIEAVSSSSGGPHRVNHNPYGHLEPPDSSSEESANDSFTCSEFEYENDKSRQDFDTEAIMFSKVPEVDENDDYNLHHNNNNRKFEDGRNSNGDSFGSSEDGHAVDIKPFNGALNWDDLLNWGPNFERLVGVFRDIASLPDGDSPGQNLIENKNEGEEEYV